jgi:membrane-bound metal-dependent hydrolase YbcI (DUF457 family)
MVAQLCASRAATSAALAVSARRDVDRESFRNVSRFYVLGHRRITIASLAVFVCGAAAWMWSLRLKEPGLQSIPLVLAFFAVLIQLLLV